MSIGGGPGYQEFEYYIKLNKLLVLAGVSRSLLRTMIKRKF